jgi:hypothetical protein
MNVKNSSQQLAISIQPKAQKQFFTTEVAKDAKEKLGYFAKNHRHPNSNYRTERSLRSPQFKSLGLAKSRKAGDKG